jgi:primase-polymerase (primpol)-like protein
MKGSVQQQASPRQVELLENIPTRFTERPQWVVWKLEKRKGEFTKVPYIAGGVGRASSTDLMTWRSFEEAVRALETGRYDGIGFVFCSGDEFVGIDLDKCRNPETGEIEEWAREIINSVSYKYVEVSPSGTGVHIITRGKLREGHKKGNLEVYGQEKFFTFTGVKL